MRTAGVMFDFYDDPRGEVLRDVFPSSEDLPEIIKEAHILDADERDSLRNEAYALIMVNEGKMLRKFACVDPGNTLLSMMYLEHAADRMAPEAIKTAAVNIQSFCEEFGMPVSPFVKMAATGMSRTRDPMQQPIVGDEADWAARTNLVSARGGADTGRVIPTANQMKTAGVVHGDSDTPMGKALRDPALRPALAKAGSGKERAQILQSFISKHKAMEKTSSWFTDVHTIVKAPKDTPLGKAQRDPECKREMGKVHPKERHLVLQKYVNMYEGGSKEKKSESLGGGQVLTDDTRFVGPDKKNPARTNGSAQSPKFQGPTVEPGPHPKVTNVVDVSGKDPLPAQEKRSYAVTALDGRYGLDTFGDVVAAVQYFEENWADMDPDDRHEYAVKTASRADDLGIEISDLMARYGSTEYAPDLEAHLASRRAVCDEDWKPVYQMFKEKVSSIHPEMFAAMLAQADSESGLAMYWGGEICDPWLSTFGGHTKEASELWTWTSSTGEIVNAEQLRKLALNRKILLSQFSQDLVDGFQKDPVKIFESLPDEHKLILCKMANDDLVKSAAFIGPASDLAGLGMLAVPGIKTLRDPHASAKEKNHAKWESAGLGTLAAGVAVNDRHELAEGAKHFRQAKGLGNKMRAAGKLLIGRH